MASKTNQSTYYLGIKQFGFSIILDTLTLKYVIRFLLVVPFHWPSAP